MTKDQPMTKGNTPILTLSDHRVQANAEKLVLAIAEAADDRKADNLMIFKVTEVSYLTDYLIIATGFSTTQVKAIADAIEEKVVATCDKYPLRVEGKREGTWILQDYGEVISHIFLPEEREFYNLEAFWGHGEQLQLSQLQETVFKADRS
ncbi:MAG TPA: ribosome silencing factor [Cyanothece sp. UBA12306]|nr:ribosome silencing factor [Cyanothece sp. UBA12306]